MTRTSDSGRLAVALHGIEPATYEHCALIRDWLTDLGVDRATLLVVPGSGCGRALAAWLAERTDGGDVVGADEPRPRRAPRRRGDLLRVDLHPADFDRTPRRTRLMERAIRHAAHRRVAVADLALCTTTQEHAVVRPAAPPERRAA